MIMPSLFKAPPCRYGLSELTADTSSGLIRQAWPCLIERRTLDQRHVNEGLATILRPAKDFRHGDKPSELVANPGLRDGFGDGDVGSVPDEQA